MAASSNIKAGRAYVEVTAETSQLKRNLAGAKAQLADFGKACSLLGQSMMLFSGAMALPFAAAEKSFAYFDDSMRLVQAVTSSTGAAFESLTKTAQRLGRETSFTAQQVADAMIALGRMGFAPSEIEASIADVLNLSRATGTDLAESADIAANSLRIFALDASKMVSVADILTATANGSAQTLHDLFEALKMAGPQAKAAGENIDEVCAALGVLANVGIKGSLAGTALRKSFSRFANVDVQKTLKDVGVATVDSNGNLRKMADIMRDVANVMNQLPTGARIAFAEDIFDIRGSLAGLSLGGNIGELDAFLAKLKDVNGQADKTARAMDAGIGGAFRLFQSAVEGAMNAAGEALTATLQPMTENVTSVINSFTKWIEANKGLVVTIAGTVASVGLLGGALFVVGSASKIIAGGFGVLTGLLSGVSGVFTALVSRGILVQNSFSLIANAFQVYGKASVPAIVGTSRLLAALNLPIESRAKQIAASLVLMSNAEAAASAKSILATRFQAAATALKSLNAATIMATVSTKARAAAEMFAATATKAATAVQAGFAAVTRVLSASHLKAVVAAGAAGTANLALAATTKVVAAGYLTASAAAAAFCAIPITWILVAVAAALAGVCAYMASATTHTAALSNEMQSLREKGDELRQTDELRMERLQQLAEKEKLNNAEMIEAENLANELKSRYGDLGISLDRTSNTLSLAADAQSRFNEALRVQAVSQLEKEISEYRKNIGELIAENKSLCGVWVNTWNTITFRGDKATNQIAANGEKIKKFYAQMAEAQKRLQAIEGGDADAVKGGKTEREALEEKVSAGRQEKHTSQDEADKAGKKAAEIEQKLLRETRTELQNEIADIEALRDEYKALIRTMLDYEKSKRTKDTEKIADLEGRLAAADATAEKRIRTAEEKARKAFENEIENLQAGFDETAEGIARRRNEGETDRQVETALKEDAASGIKLLSDLILQSKVSAAAAKAEFEKALAEAQADGTVSDDERERIRKAQDAYTLAEGLVDKYAGKLRDAKSATEKSLQTTVKPQGTFSARAASVLRGNQMEQRMLTVSQEIAKNTKKSVELLKDGVGGTPTFQ